LAPQVGFEPTAYRLTELEPFDLNYNFFEVYEDYTFIFDPKRQLSAVFFIIIILKNFVFL